MSEDHSEQRSWFARHKILTGIGIVLALSLLGSLSKGQGSRSDGGSQAPPDEQPEITISAHDLSQAFKDNEIRANQTYKGKLAMIYGDVHRVDEIFGKTVLTLAGAPWAPGVSCVFQDKSVNERIAGLDAGTVVTVIGTITGKSISVHVKKCTFK